MIDGRRYISTEGLGSVKDIPLSKASLHLRVDANFRNRKDQGNFYYSLDGINWNLIGDPLHMEYTIPHFMGYRFALFNYATKISEGYTDFDYFHLRNSDNTKLSTTNK